MKNNPLLSPSSSSNRLRLWAWAAGVAGSATAAAVVASCCWTPVTPPTCPTVSALGAVEDDASVGPVDADPATCACASLPPVTHESPNGPALQGTSINACPSQHQDSALIRAFDLSAMTKGSKPIKNGHVAAGALAGRIEDPGVTPVELFGAAWVDVHLGATVECIGRSATHDVGARITAATQDASDPATWHYAVVAADPNDPSKELPACSDAIAIPGYWARDTAGHYTYHYSDQKVTFACQGGAAAKCYGDGKYKWWMGRTELYLACTRMLRADYCGDGVSHTQTGASVDYWDPAGIDTQTIPAPTNGTATMTFEAAWSATGAICGNHTRLSKDTLSCTPPPVCASSTAAPTSPAPVLFNQSYQPASFGGWPLP